MEIRGVELSLEGRVAVITGASSGIGFAIARAFGEAGARCVLVARDADNLERAAASISRSCGVPTHGVAVDVMDEGAPQRVMREATERFGDVTILVNAAAKASSGQGEDWESYPESEILAEFSTKYVGYLRMARAAAPFMKHVGWGRIVNVVGLAARRSGLVSTGGRNAAVVNLSATLADALGPHGVTVNSVHPAVTRTEHLRGRLQRRADGAAGVDELMDALASSSRIRRLADATEVAALVLFLASDFAGAITGEAIAIGGGEVGIVRL